MPFMKSVLNEDAQSVSSQCFFLMDESTATEIPEDFLFNK